MSPELAIELARKALLTAGLLALPALAAGLIVGLVVSIFQAITQIHEITLTFIPKMIAIGIALYFFLPWMIKTMLYYTSTLYINFSLFLR